MGYNKMALPFDIEEANRELDRALIDFLVPVGLHHGIKQYVLYGRPAGHFLNAVIQGNLFETMSRADKENLRSLHEICSFFYNVAPSGCVGTKERFEAWIDTGGFHGLIERARVEKEKLLNENRQTR